ncbi:MAG: MarR family transcriptional regulator, lower aerobic nicotinate degradation pathway regulator [Gaiellaceae bacterium]|nr:MarR family transcriptional regulator, lower aerobic nicotinate degradation pathway regulator [Gaiellaceae bacterium]
MASATLIPVEMSISDLKELRGPKAAAALPEELLACTGFLLSRVGIAMKLAAMEEFERKGFNPYAYAVLAVLAEGAKETQATIADTLDLDRSQMVGILDGLEAEGLIERRRDPTDRRRHTVSITPAGKKQLVKMRAMVRELENAMLGTLGDEERATLRDFLQRIASSNDHRFG